MIGYHPPANPTDYDSHRKRVSSRPKRAARSGEIRFSTTEGSPLNKSVIPSWVPGAPHLDSEMWFAGSQSSHCTSQKCHSERRTARPESRNRIFCGMIGYHPQQTRPTMTHTTSACHLDRSALREVERSASLPLNPAPAKKCHSERSPEWGAVEEPAVRPVGTPPNPDDYSPHRMRLSSRTQRSTTKANPDKSVNKRCASAELTHRGWTIPPLLLDTPDPPTAILIQNTSH
jgi:hypothetical protein